jgi:hypothetical protein
MEHQDKPRFSFSKEIRLGDMLTVAGLGLATLAFGQKVDFRIEQLERAQAVQVITNGEMRKDLKEVSEKISGELKEQGGAIRRIEDKVNRARL